MSYQHCAFDRFLWVAAMGRVRRASDQQVTVVSQTEAGSLDQKSHDEKKWMMEAYERDLGRKLQRCEWFSETLWKKMESQVQSLLSF